MPNTQNTKLHPTFFPPLQSYLFLPTEMRPWTSGHHAHTTVHTINRFAIQRGTSSHHPQTRPNWKGSVCRMERETAGGAGTWQGRAALRDWQYSPPQNNACYTPIFYRQCNKTHFKMECYKYYYSHCTCVQKRHGNYLVPRLSFSKWHYLKVFVYFVLPQSGSTESWTIFQNVEYQSRNFQLFYLQLNKLYIF